MNIQTLPPKMAQSYADMAKRGDFDAWYGSECYAFFRGNMKISLVSINPPIGHVQKLTTKEMERERERSKAKDGNS